ncbi:MAG: hypothetical protein JNJ77_20005 [Planctomycetia bacterium]|nr:hypothetical protein [Planctomycetia bacterium]
MPQPPPDHHAVASLGSFVTWILVAVLCASLSALRRTVTMFQALIHIAMASVIGSIVPYVVTDYFKLPFSIGVAIAMGIGLLIFGIVVMFDRTEKRVGSIDPTNALPDKFRPPPEGGN